MTIALRCVRAAGKAAVRVLPLAAGTIPAAAMRDAAAEAGFAGAAGQSCEIFAGAERLLLVGLGARSDGDAWRAAGALAVVRLATAPRIALDGRGLAAEPACEFAAGAAMRAWRPPHFRTQDDDGAPALAAIDLVVDDPAAMRPAWTALCAALEGQVFARDLVAAPANRLTPEDFVGRLTALRAHGVEVEVLREDALARDGCHALLAVGRASAHPPRLAVLRWPGARAGAPVAFVGKGITFDTGGVCIKPADKMWEMRADMAGAAACAGAILALARRRSRAPAVAVLALAENAIGAASYRPGDVLRSAEGRTIEVVDTDAEGRLVLADALAWTARHLKPAAMIDAATLTGSIVVALGHEKAGLFASDRDLAASIVAAGAEIGEAAWPMPIGERHRKDLDSDIADLRHCVPGRLQPDACQAAAFLREFAGGIPWAHLDIAGVESRESADDAHAPGATGFGVRLLDRLAARRFEAG